MENRGINVTVIEGRSMRGLWHATLAFIVGIGVFVGSGCYSACKDLDCTQGECVNGECVCRDGYSGEFCETSNNEKFDGIYQVVEITEGGNFSYQMEIRPTLGNADRISLIGLYRIPLLHVPGIVGGDGRSLQIPPTRVGNGTISSTGACTSTADGKSITLTYQYVSDSTGLADACTASLSRN